ncbi:hypothetical protein [Arenimonas sp.]|uniref:hypothetical protein n=1 Tax=Arenimonas sp. TaxID=1872635 RepID=UPI0039E21E81
MASIKAGLAARTDTIHAAIDAVASAIKPVGGAVMAQRILPVSGTIQSLIDPVAAAIPAVFDPVAAIVGLDQGGRQQQGQG